MDNHLDKNIKPPPWPAWGRLRPTGGTQEQTLKIRDERARKAPQSVGYTLMPGSSGAS